MTIEEVNKIDWQTVYRDIYLRDHHGCQYIAKSLGCSPSTVHRNFVKHGYKMRNNHDKSRKYTCNYNYFDVIDTEDKAYFLGFIYADGYITMNKFGMSLQVSDRKVLEDLCRCMDCTIPIHEYESSGYSAEYPKHTKYCRIIVTNDHMVESLIKDGVVRHKTTILKPPTCVPDNLIRHFIRGYTDGDGTVYKSCGSCFIRWTGTTEFLTWIGNHLIQKGLVDKYTIKPQTHSDKAFCFGFGGSTKPLSVMYYLYEDSNYYLSRKYNRYKEYMEWKKPNLSQTVLDSIKDENNG